MVRILIVIVVVFACSLAGVRSQTLAQDKCGEKRVGTVIGELKSRQEVKGSQSVVIEILGVGEEKARRYLVAYNPRDPGAKGPFLELLAAVNAAKVGDRVQCDWINAPKGSEGGFFVTGLKVLQKSNPGKKDTGDKK